MFARIRAAFTAFRAAGQTPHPSQQENGIHGDISGTAVQARDVSGGVRMGDTHHHGPTVSDPTGPMHAGRGDQYNGSIVHHGYGDQIGSVTNNNHGGNVGMQLGHVNGGVFNVGGTISGSAIGHGATVTNGGNHVGVNHGQVVSTDRIDGGVNFGR